MQIKLVVVEGAASRGEVQLRLPAVIGRSKDANLTIGHPKVSRRHCELYEEAGRVMIRDHGSLNGTILDGNRVSQAAVPSGAKLSIGPLTFIALFDSPSAAHEPSVPVIASGDEGSASDRAAPDFSPGPDTDAAGFDLSEDLLPPSASAAPSLDLTVPQPAVPWQKPEMPERDDATAAVASSDNAAEGAMASAPEAQDEDLNAFLRELGR